MNIVIIEDEQLTAEDLKEAILQADPTAHIVAVLNSVKESLHYFNNNAMPQLIFSDIQLGDGLSFDIFTKIDIKAPVIFCTAFDEYAINAFNANGIHYILKPFNVNKIREALHKYHTLQRSFTTQINTLVNVIKAFNDTQLQPMVKKTGSILVYYQNKVIPVRLDEVALFFIKNEVTHLYTFDQKTYVVSKTLDELQQLDNEMFYRANRQFIINRSVVREASHYQARKVSIELSVPFKETVTISKEKIAHFFEWLEGHQHI